MALDFPNSPTDGQVYTDPASGEQWVYEAATNSWTSKGLVNPNGGTSYKGSLDITAAPPAGVQSGWMYSALATGTANAGFAPGLTGTVTKGDLILFTGAEWTDTSHSVPDATAAVKGVDVKLWKRTGTALAPETAADTVQISAGTAALPGLTPAGDPNTGIYSPGADQLAISTNGTDRLFVDSSGEVRFTNGSAEHVRIDATGRLLVGTSSSLHNNAPLQTAGTGYYGYNHFQFSNDAFAPTISVKKSRGATVGTNTIVQDGDRIGTFSFFGADGSSYIQGADITASVDGTPGANDMPTRLAFGTTPSGPGGILTERMRIKSSGIVNIANTPTYADNTAATAGGLVAGDIYRKADGTLMITF